MDPVELLKEKRFLACKIFQSQKLFDGFGHVTLRAGEDRILSTPEMPPGKVSMRDFIILNMEGEKLEGFGEPNGETPMHTSIYRARPEVKCILHYHSDPAGRLHVSAILETSKCLKEGSGGEFTAVL